LELPLTTQLYRTPIPLTWPAKAHPHWCAAIGPAALADRPKPRVTGGYRKYSKKAARPMQWRRTLIGYLFIVVKRPFW